MTASTGASFASSRCQRLSQRRPVRHPGAPIQAVAEQHFLAGLGLLAGVPESDDVVEGFVDGGYLDQLNRTLAPPGAVGSRFRFDPQAGPPVVVDAVVLIVIEISIALKQAEAPGIVVEIRIQMQLRRIDERAPDPFAGAGPHRYAVGIVDLGPPIVGAAAIVLAVEEHAGERRDP